MTISVPTAERLQVVAEDRLTKAGASAEEERWGDLLAAAQQGDAPAYRTFLEAILPFARGVARRHSRSADEVEDVVQESLLTLHRVRHTYEPGRPVKPWLAAIVTRRAIDSLRRRGRVAARELQNHPRYETFADPAAKQGEDGLVAGSLAPMMAELTPGQREAIELVKLREMSLVEASAASGQSIASLKVNIHRAMKKLRRFVSKDGEK